MWEKRLRVVVGGLVVAGMLWASGVAPAIVPALVPTANKRGNSSLFQLATGTTPAGNCASWDASGNLVDSGVTTCGGGGTAVSSVNGATGVVTVTTTAGTGVSVSGGAGITPTVSLTTAQRQRSICLVIGANNAGSVIVDGDLGPQSRQYFVNAAWTLIEAEVAADAGTPNIIMGKSHAGSITNLTSSALATAAAGGIACSNTGGTLGLDLATTCSGTLQNTSFAAGDWITLVSGTAGGVAKEMTACATFTVN